MDEQRQELIENFNHYHIGLDDTFAFKCRSCGKCCKNRDDILLNSRDVYNIATALDLTHEQVIKRYSDVYIGGSSRLPVVRLKPKGVKNVCPLLANKRCSVHSLKPTVCALFPLGRVMTAEGTPKEMGLSAPGKIAYILNPANCGSARRKQTVLNWLERFDISIDDAFFIEWNKTIFELTSAIQKYEGKDAVTDKAMGMMWDGIFMALYIDYDTQKEFYPQFEVNATKILSIFSELGRFEF